MDSEVVTLYQIGNSDILNPIEYLLMKMENPQTSTSEFRKSSVKIALDSDQSIKQKAEGLGIKPST